MKIWWSPCNFAWKSVRGCNVTLRKNLLWTGSVLISWPFGTVSVVHTFEARKFSRCLLINPLRMGLRRWHHRGERLWFTLETIYFAILDSSHKAGDGRKTTYNIFSLVLGRARVHSKRVLCALLELISSKMHDLRLSRAVAHPLQRVVSPDQHEIAI